MANTLLTPDIITKEALRILHEKLTFVGTINREYDSSFAQSGAKIGTALRIRKPNQYVVRTGAALSTQDTTETQETLTVATQKGVDLTFSSVELTMDLDNFSQRILTPAMAVLASNIEADVLSNVGLGVNNYIDSFSSAMTYLDIMNARAKLNENLTPKDNQRCIMIDSPEMAIITDAFKGLFNDSADVSKAYREGMITRHGGFNWYENERMPSHTNGADIVGVAVDDAAGVLEGATSVNMDGFTVSTAGIITKGSIISFTGINAVHPETKADLGYVQQFVVTADGTSDSNGDVVVSFSPAMYASGGQQNVTALAADDNAVVFVGAAATQYTSGLAYHKDFATFATADLVMPSDVDFSSRQNYDGISLRIIRQYDISDDTFPCRLDILYGSKVLYPQLAVRLLST